MIKEKEGKERKDSVAMEGKREKGEKKQKVKYRVKTRRTLEERRKRRRERTEI